MAEADLGLRDQDLRDVGRHFLGYDRRGRPADDAPHAYEGADAANPGYGNAQYLSTLHRANRPLSGRPWFNQLKMREESSMGG